MSLGLSSRTNVVSAFLTSGGRWPGDKADKQVSWVRCGEGKGKLSLLCFPLPPLKSQLLSLYPLSLVDLSFALWLNLPTHLQFY